MTSYLSPKMRIRMFIDYMAWMRDTGSEEECNASTLLKRIKVY